MKRKFLSVAVTFLVLLNGLSFAGCDAFDNPNNNNEIEDPKNVEIRMDKKEHCKAPAWKHLVHYRH